MTSGRLEHFVTDVAGVGRFQVLLMASMYLVSGLSSWGMMMMAFAGYDPGWTCSDAMSYSGLNMSGLETPNISKPPGNQTFIPGTVHQDTFRPNSSTKDMCELVKSCPRIVFTPGTSTIITEWTLICDRAWITSLIISIQMVGQGIGSYTGGYLGDRFGRKAAIYQMVILSAVFNGIAVFSVSWEMFAVCRFFIGIAVGGLIIVLNVLPLEFLTMSWRLVFTSFPGWYIATSIFGVLVWILRDWRYIHVGCTALSCLNLLSMYWVPESMRWLALNGKTDQAKDLAKRILKYNRQPCPVDELIDFTDSEETENKENTSILLLFKKPLLKKSICCIIVNLIISLVFYAVGFGVKALFGDFYLNFIIYSLLFIPAAPFIPIIGNKLGRRWGTVALLGLGGFMSFGVVIVSLTTDGPLAHTAITGLALTSTVCVGSAWSVFSTLCVELLPTSVRSVGYGFTLLGARVGGVLAPFLIPRSPSDLHIPYLVMGGLVVMACALVLCLPESKGQIMVEISSEIKNIGLGAELDVSVVGKK